MSDTCVRCGDNGPDLRTLWMACFYQMSEMPVPFELKGMGDRQFYTLRVCKDCRADWMDSIATWFATPQPRESTGTGVFVRELGTSIELSHEEIAQRFPGAAP